MYCMHPWVRRDIAIASNVSLTQNPPYTIAMFRAAFPAFTEDIIPDSVIENFIYLADATIKKAKFHEAWSLAMGYFIAHFATKFLETQVPEGATKEEILAAAQSSGLATSKSVGPISVSYDYTWLTNAFPGWGDFATTTFGQQYISLAKPITGRPMLVW